jgi:hypothetical protein
MSRRIPQVKTFGCRPPALRPFVPPQTRIFRLPEDNSYILSTYKRPLKEFSTYDRYYLCKRWLEIPTDDDDQERDELSKAWLTLHGYARISRNVNYARACPYDPEVAAILENARDLLLRAGIALPL